MILAVYNHLFKIVQQLVQGTILKNKVPSLCLCVWGKRPQNTAYPQTHYTDVENILV